MKLKVFFVLALLSAGCFGQVVDETGNADSSSKRGQSAASEDVPNGAPSAGTGVASGTCWQSSPDLPPSTGPSGTLASCSLVGTWTYDVLFSDTKNYRTVWSFDGEGRMVGGPEGTNVCQGFQWSGNYTLDASRIGVTGIRGEGARMCNRDFVSTFRVAWSPDCRTMDLPNDFSSNDSCTSAGLFYHGKMTKID